MKHPTAHRTALSECPHPDARFFRGLLFALPLSLALWVLIAAVAVVLW